MNCYTFVKLSYDTQTTITKLKKEIRLLTDYIFHLQKEVQKCKLYNNKLLSCIKNNKKETKMPTSMLNDDLKKVNRYYEQKIKMIYEENQKRQVGMNKCYKFSEQNVKILKEENAALKQIIKNNKIRYQSDQVQNTIKLNDLTRQLQNKQVQIQILKQKQLNKESYQLSSIKEDDQDQQKREQQRLYEYNQKDMILLKQSHRKVYQIYQKVGMASNRSEIIQLSTQLKELLPYNESNQTLDIINAYVNNFYYPNYHEQVEIYFQEKIIFLNNFTSLCQKYGQMEHIEKMYNQVIQLQEKYFSKSDERTIITKNNFACFYAQKGNKKKALKIFIQCSKIIKQHNLNGQLAQLVQNNCLFYFKNNNKLKNDVRI